MKKLFKSGFHINMKRSNARAPKGKIPVVEVPNMRTVSHSIISSILFNTFIKVEVRVSNEPQFTKKRNMTSRKKNLMDELDNFPKLKTAFLL
ncbi:unnamed protein product [Cunninghamella echinulata]